MSVNFNEGQWAVVQVGNQKLIGTISGSWRESDLLIEQAIGFFEQNVAIPLPDGRGIAFQRVTRGVPVDACLGPATIQVRATSVHFFTAMSDVDRKRHQELYMTCIRECEAEVARQSPILSPGPRRD